MREFVEFESDGNKKTVALSIISYVLLIVKRSMSRRFSVVILRSVTNSYENFASTNKWNAVILP